MGHASAGSKASRGGGSAMICLQRIWSICMGSLLTFFLVVGRLGYLQIYCHAALTERAERERSQHTLDMPRGAIFDRSGHVLAMSIGGGSCFADPKLIKNPLATAQWLSPMINVPVPVLQAKLTQRKRF